MELNPGTTEFDGNVSSFIKNSTGTVINPSTEDTLTKLVGDYAIQMDDVSTTNITYVGKAAIGSAVGSAVWQIKKINETGSPISMVITYADGDASFNNIWSNRTSLTYS